MPQAFPTCRSTSTSPASFTRLGLNGTISASSWCTPRTVWFMRSGSRPPRSRPSTASSRRRRATSAPGRCERFSPSRSRSPRRAYGERDLRIPRIPRRVHRHLFRRRAGRDQTLPLLLYTASAGGNYQIASITALILLVPSVAFMFVVERFIRADVLARVGR